jgi:hypothetical protein
MKRLIALFKRRGQLARPVSVFEFLQPADRPVIDGLEDHEIVMAKHQPEYVPLRCLAGNTDKGQRLSRWTLTAEQRKAVAAGADIFLELWTFNRPMNPIRMAVSDGPNAEYFRAVYRIS